MNKYNFKGSIFLANNITFAQSPFKWEKVNSFLGRKIAEYHYKCANTGAYMCKEYKEEGGLKSITYAMPESDDYNIKTEEELIMKIYGIKQIQK